MKRKIQIHVAAGVTGKVNAAYWESDDLEDVTDVSLLSDAFVRFDGGMTREEDHVTLLAEVEIDVKSLFADRIVTAQIVQPTEDTDE